MKARIEAAHRIDSVSPVERPSITAPLSGPSFSVFSHLQTEFTKKNMTSILDYQKYSQESQDT